MSKSIFTRAPTFIDLFSGCGGLSLGLSQSGWTGLFAVERASDAFETFKANFLVDGARHRFFWPTWLEKRAHSIDDVLAKHQHDLHSLRGKVDLIAGGPPCQGFSFAGKRDGADPRNRMFERYVAFVDLVQPKYLVLENVPGMNVMHAAANHVKARGKEISYYEKLVDALNAIGYVVSGEVLDASKFGVPQRRPRLVVIGMRSDIAKKLKTGATGVFRLIEALGRRQLSKYGAGSAISAEQAISDLVVGRAEKRSTIEYSGRESKRGYRQLKYVRPLTKYQARMNKGVPPDKMDSMRLANHRPHVEERFDLILTHCRRGFCISAHDRAWLGILKHRTVPMAPRAPAPTLTTLPDDVLHYKDPRILTVRESARIQSFPDWFVFKGKYTTGGARRRVECPRYTQVGNAVPPLLAKAIGAGILKSLRSIEGTAAGGPRGATLKGGLMATAR